jgi:hypothetical protein
MTEADWNACADPDRMVEFIRGRASERKLRLFAVACCRRFPHLATLSEIWVAERAADGAAAPEELAAARAESARAYEQAAGQFSSITPPPYVLAFGAALAAVSSQAAEAASASSKAAAAFAGRGELASQAALLHCIFGNPFRAPPSIDLAWLAYNDGAVRKLAQSIYDERAFGRLLMLADAVEEAGCADAGILAHCREPGEHVRGCWVVDLLFGKS